MNYGTNGTSVRRNLLFLTPAEKQAFEPTEAELLARDHAVNLSKRMGCYDTLRDRFALQQQINAGGL